MECRCFDPLYQRLSDSAQPTDAVLTAFQGEIVAELRAAMRKCRNHDAHVGHFENTGLRLIFSQACAAYVPVIEEWVRVAPEDHILRLVMLNLAMFASQLNGHNALAEEYAQMLGYAIERLAPKKGALALSYQHNIALMRLIAALVGYTQIDERWAESQAQAILMPTRFQLGGDLRQHIMYMALSRLYMTLADRAAFQSNPDHTARLRHKVSQYVEMADIYHRPYWRRR